MARNQWGVTGQGGLVDARRLHGSLCRSNSQSRKMSWSVSTERKWPATVASVFVTGQVTPCSHSTTLYATLYDDADRTGFLVGPRSNFQSLPGPLLVRVGQLSCLCPRGCSQGEAAMAKLIVTHRTSLS